ncbi:hypothetical protein FA13DRAFT_1725122, partial [Coprinellus micaceus]
ELYGRNVTPSQASPVFLIFAPAILAARLRRDPPKWQVSRTTGVGFLSSALNRSVTLPLLFLPYSSLQ